MVLCHQLRTIVLDRVTAFEVKGDRQYVTDPDVRRDIRKALSHLGLDLPPTEDGAA